MTASLLHHLLLDAAHASPDALALREPKASRTYAELVGESGAVAAALAEAGVGPGGLVGLCAEKTCSAVAWAYAALRRGAAYVPIDPALPRARAQVIVDRAALPVVVTTPDRVALFAAMREGGGLPALRALVVPAANDEAKALAAAAGLALVVVDPSAPPPPEPAVASRRLAYVLHTSGSTGVPKGVAISHDDAMAFVRPAARAFGLLPGDVFAGHAPLHFDLSVFDLYCAALLGGTVSLLPEFYSAFPHKITEQLASHRVTVWNSVVSALALLDDKGRLDRHPLEDLRVVCFSGERMPVPLLRRLVGRLPRATFFNVYGQTEANSSMTLRVESVPADDAASLELGEPLPGFEVFLVDEGGAPLGPEPGVVGELVVRAGTVASGGYLRDPERTRERFVPDPADPLSGARVYRTGDLARREASGALVLAGRRDAMVKTRGYRVELPEIEVALDGVPGVGEVAVVAIPDPAITNRLVAFVRLAEGIEPGAGDAPTPASLAAYLGERLPKYMVPDRIEVHAELPRTSSGKIDRAALAASAREERP